MKWMRFAARFLSLIWAAWRIFFGLTSGIVEGLGPGEIFRYAALPGLVFLVSAATAWRWEAVGGIVLILEGLTLLVLYPMNYSHLPISTVILTLIALAIPPLVAGVLFVVVWRRLVGAV